MTALLIHSSGFTSRQWKRLATELGKTRRVLAPDLIGYAPDDRWPDGKPFHFSIDCDRLIGLIDEDDEPVDLVGHSYGGFLALQIALRVPARVRRIAVYEPVAFGIFDDPGNELPTYSLDDPDAWFRYFVEWWNGKGAWDALPEDTKRSFRDVGWKLSEEVRTLGEDRTGKRYAEIAAPTLVLGGELTPLPEQRVVDELGRTLPNVRIEKLPGMGHMGPITHSSIVNAKILEHLG